MAVPFRRTSKTAKRKRRTHYKLQAPTLVVCKETGEFTLPHRVTKNSGYYKGRLVLNAKKEKSVESTQVAQKTKNVETLKKEKELAKEIYKKQTTPKKETTTKKAETAKKTSQEKKQATTKKSETTKKTK